MPDLWLGSAVIGCTDFPRMFAFWQAALGYVSRDPQDAGGVVLRDPAGPDVSLCRTKEGPLHNYRLHLDRYSSEPEQEMERLLCLGATLKRPADADHDLVTLTDPDGNPFDVIDKRGWAFGRRV